MKNNFPQWVYDLFDMGGFCRDFEDGQNDANSLHHICGRRDSLSSSPYNALPLNNFRNHLPEGRTQQNKPPIGCRQTQENHLICVKKYLDDLGYIPKPKDVEFLKKYKDYYKGRTP